MTRKNLLGLEKSPYLLSHAQNPVHWQPWGEAAFALARAEQKPVFLSIGYFTCHWCHVMERESFEDVEVAKILNEHFICVKVDREERPDIDQIYMRICQSLTGSGGWPLTAVLTPEKEAFFTATYIPRENKGERIGLLELLPRIAELWENRRDYVISSAKNLAAGLAQAYAPKPSASSIPPSVFTEALETLSETFDPENGGFGSAPKFPSPHQLSFLLLMWEKRGDERILRAARATAEAWLGKGLRDQLGGGFHRYCVDKNWKTPHFEKMLYDQAGISLALTGLYLATKVPRFREALLETLNYAERALSSPIGGFYCGEDADSEGEEGLFYLWEKGEIIKILGYEDGEYFCRAYGVTDGGNPIDEATKAPTGKNILSHSPDFASLDGPRLKEMAQKLFAEREKRHRPGLDDKILTGWSAFMAIAFARAGQALGDERLVDRAKATLEFIEKTMTREAGLLRRHRDGEAAVEGFLEDYAFTALLCLALRSATLEKRFLEKAEALGDEIWERFSDGEALFDSQKGGEALLFRPREFTDGAMVSPNAVAMEVFARLNLVTGEKKWESRARSLSASVAETLRSHPHAFTGFMAGLDILMGNGVLVTVRGRRAEEKTEKLLDFLAKRGSASVEALFEEGEGPATAQPCAGQRCLLPVGEVEELEKALKEARGPR